MPLGDPRLSAPAPCGPEPRALRWWLRPLARRRERVAALRRAGSPSPNTSGRLRLSSVSIPPTSTPTNGGTLSACWFITGLLVIRDEDAFAQAIAKQQRWKVIVFRFVSSRKPVAEHRQATLRLLPRGLVLDDVPVLREYSVLHAHDISDNPRHRTEAAEPPVQNDEVPGRRRSVVLVAQRRGHGPDQAEQPLTAGRNVCAVLDVIRRPEALGRSVVALVEQRIKRSQDGLDVLVFLCGHGHSPWVLSLLKTRCRRSRRGGKARSSCRRDRGSSIFAPRLQASPGQVPRARPCF